MARYVNHSAMITSLLFVILLTNPGCTSKPEPLLPPKAQGTTIVRLSDHWKLSQPGGAISIRDTVLMRALIITHAEDGTYHAFDSWCPHTGCPVTPSPAPGDENLECPCHGSTFNLEGTVQKGPSPISLIEYTLETQGDSLIIDLSKRMVQTKEK